jgi:hypothetical protein
MCTPNIVPSTHKYLLLHQTCSRWAVSVTIWYFAPVFFRDVLSRGLHVLNPFRHYDILRKRLDQIAGYNRPILLDKPAAEASVIADGAELTRSPHEVSDVVSGSCHVQAAAVHYMYSGNVLYFYCMYE